MVSLVSSESDGLGYFGVWPCVEGRRGIMELGERERETEKRQWERESGKSRGRGKVTGVCVCVCVCV
ncbi:hypothetical protein D8674_010336 [Pyrus ussuriensis x Pyrus communis]|uniref:Uncharacterized protein n=1 Tax=Pyrus ussuriensis x Pyrus communis TaxID=2448454 RepID=A0A5N5FAG7_9ROSA|nr:hypothetical protein D8674_010336 [Pyrus ussuriensis x Pyrus communis]